MWMGGDNPAGGVCYPRTRGTSDELGLGINLGIPEQNESPERVNSGLSWWRWAKVDLPDPRWPSFASIRHCRIFQRFCCFVVRQRSPKFA